MSVSLALAKAIRSDPFFEKGFQRLYGAASAEDQKKRYLKLLERGRDRFDSTRPFFISAPGRTELGGNHTDHNNGRVLAAAVDLDCVALIVPSNKKSIILFSDEPKHFLEVDLTRLTAVDGEKGTPEALIRGVASGLQKRSIRLNGFTAFLHSTCLPGSGLSSSAAFSVLIGAAISCLDGRNVIDPVELAHVACAAENSYFGKPCGLMDQMASAIGGTIGIDFKEPDNPKIIPIKQELNSFGYQLVIIDTGESHAELTPLYAAIPEEIKQAVRVFNKDKARGITMEMLFEQINQIRKVAGDRACLRLMHFIREDRRTVGQIEALKNGNFGDFLQLVKQSGHSSCSFLQNCTSVTDTRNQGILLALAVTEELCPAAVVRVHGGGFAGTIQAYIPNNELDKYCRNMKTIFGNSSVIPVRTGRPGVCSLTEDGWLFPEIQDKRYATHNDQ